MQFQEIQSEIYQILDNIKKGSQENSQLLASIHERIDQQLSQSKDQYHTIQKLFLDFSKAVEHYDLHPSSPALQFVDQMATSFLKAMEEFVKSTEN